MPDDYNIETDTMHKRLEFREVSRDDGWQIERPLYDIKYDAYWLVRKYRLHNPSIIIGNAPWCYRFIGPVQLSGALLDLMPSMSEEERRHVIRHAPRGYTDLTPHGVEVEVIEEQDDVA